MITSIQKNKWDSYIARSKKLLLWGLQHGYISIYSNELINKLRTIYDGGLPASILLLSKGMSNGHCYDRARLMARAFLNEDNDIKLIYASIDNLRLNPDYSSSTNPMETDHCFIEITSKENEPYIIDTSTGFIYHKKMYWLMEHPIVRRIDNKEEIIKSVELDKDNNLENIERDKYAAPLILPMIEMSYERPYEMYSWTGIELLQREIEHFKKVINYEDICKEIDRDMKKLGLKK